MAHSYSIPPWKTAPFIRLLFPFIAGILAQWYLGFSLYLILLTGTTCCLSFFLLSSLRISRKYKLRSLQGILLQLLICSAGLLITWQQDAGNHPGWYGKIYKDSLPMLVTIAEPLEKKERSAKATGRVDAIISNGKLLPVKGKLLLYFTGETPPLQYGNRILIKKPLQEIRNSGNPGAFDYRRYAGFQQTYHNIFLGGNDFIVLTGNHANPFWRFIYASRKHIIKVLQQNLSKDKGTIGIAEALLIGYKEDLDRGLVQAYSNAGVVHIIAISGLHLGLIYFMLSWILNRLPYLKKHSLAKIVVILGSLWLFAIITGSSASVLRSAVMFSCILLGKTYFKQSSVYNSLASSAFILLCYNPYFLWDVGFQLSYLAVIGIVWLQQPIYRLLYVKNKWLNKIWNMVTVTVAAQVAAFPLCIYYFHQFPNLFLLTNLIAVPLSTVILFAEIFLLAFSWIDFVAKFTGKLVSLLISLMNYVINSFNSFSWSVLDGIYANVVSTWLLYAIVGCCGGWLLYRKKVLARSAILSFLLFLLVHLYVKTISYRQKMIIVYNINRCQAIDIISGDRFYFIGDSSLKSPGMQYDFHLKPARTGLQVAETLELPPGLKKISNLWQFAGINMLIIDQPVAYQPVYPRIPLHILVLSKNPSVKIAGVVAAFKPSIIIFDSSNSLWKIANWKKECEQLLLRFHSVPENGAFVYDIKEAND